MKIILLFFLIAINCQYCPFFFGTTVFEILAKSGVYSTGNTTVNQAVGVTNGTVNGFPPATTYPIPNNININDAYTADAMYYAQIIYNFGQGIACNEIFVPPGNLVGYTFVPGVYCFSSMIMENGVLTLDDNNVAEPYWIFRMSSTLEVMSGSMRFLNAGSPCQVLWMTGSTLTIDSGISFIGNVITTSNITSSNSDVTGRLISLNNYVNLNGGNYIFTAEPYSICVDYINNTYFTIQNSQYTTTVQNNNYTIIDTYSNTTNITTQIMCANCTNSNTTYIYQSLTCNPSLSAVYFYQLLDSFICSSANTTSNSTVIVGNNVTTTVNTTVCVYCTDFNLTSNVNTSSINCNSYLSTLSYLKNTTYIISCNNTNSSVITISSIDVNTTLITNNSTFTTLGQNVTTTVNNTYCLLCNTNNGTYSYNNESCYSNVNVTNYFNLTGTIYCYFFSNITNNTYTNGANVTNIITLTSCSNCTYNSNYYILTCSSSINETLYFQYNTTVSCNNQNYTISNTSFYTYNVTTYVNSTRITTLYNNVTTITNYTTCTNCTVNNGTYSYNNITCNTQTNTTYQTIILDIITCIPFQNTSSKTSSHWYNTTIETTLNTCLNCTSFNQSLITCNTTRSSVTTPKPITLRKCPRIVEAPHYVIGMDVFYRVYRNYEREIIRFNNSRNRCRKLDEDYCNAKIEHYKLCELYPERKLCHRRFNIINKYTRRCFESVSGCLKRIYKRRGDCRGLCKKTVLINNKEVVRYICITGVVQRDVFNNFSLISISALLILIIVIFLFRPVYYTEQRKPEFDINKTF